MSGGGAWRHSPNRIFLVMYEFVASTQGLPYLILSFPYLTGNFVLVHTHMIDLVQTHSIITFQFFTYS